VHTFATVQEFVRFRTVTYYTLKREGSASTETDDFLHRMEQEAAFKDQFEQLVKWIKVIGDDNEGANFGLFRQEGLCVALPPQGRYLGATIDLRLYCYWVSENIIILYNGGIKTARAAQDCPNVSRHFYNAQSWTKQLLGIGIERNGRTITNLEELYIKY
jgi:hypothetical protein